MDIQEVIRSSTTNTVVALYERHSRNSACGYSGNAARYPKEAGAGNFLAVNPSAHPEILEGHQGICELANHSADLYQRGIQSAVRHRNVYFRAETASALWPKSD